MKIGVYEVAQPEHFDHMPPAHYALGRHWIMPHTTALTLACHAINQRYRVSQMFDLPRAGMDEAYFRVGEKLLMAKLIHRDSPELSGAPVATLYIDDALNVVAASGDNQGGWGPFWATVEARDAAAEGWLGQKVPFALHAENHEGKLHVLWREGDVLAAADTDPARWDSRWETVQNWMVTPRGRKVHLFSPLAWSDLRVRPLGPPRPRQRHVGAVTA